MSRHSKNNTASSIFTYGEKQKLKEYGTLKQRIGQDSQRKFEMCHLCLHKVENPKSCEEGHIFCNDCIVEYLVNEKKRLKKLVEEYEDKIKAVESKKGEETQRNKEKFISDNEKIDKVTKNSKNMPRGINDPTEEEEIINKIKSSQMNTLMTEKSELIRENFWIPETNRKPEDILGERPSDKILCPASRNHPISYKKIYKAQFCEDTEKNFVCYSCKKEMKFQKVLMGRKCGHVFCKVCMEKLCLKEGKCMMCNLPVKKEDVIAITEGFTSFIMHNNVEAERYQPAFVG